MKKLFKEYSTHIGVAFLFLLVFSPMILSVAFSSHDQVYYGECAIVTSGFYKGFVGYAWESESLSVTLTVIKELPSGNLIKERISVSTGRVQTCDESQLALLEEIYEKWDNQ